MPGFTGCSLSPAPRVSSGKKINESPRRSAAAAGSSGFSSEPFRSRSTPRKILMITYRRKALAFQYSDAATGRVRLRSGQQQKPRLSAGEHPYSGKQNGFKKTGEETGHLRRPPCLRPPLQSKPQLPANDNLWPSAFHLRQSVVHTLGVAGCAINHAAETFALRE